MKNIKFLHRYKVVKVCEMTFFTVVAVVFLLTLLCNESLRETIFTNESLLFLCSVIYVAMAGVFGFLIYDFVKIKNQKTINLDLGNVAYLDLQTGLPNRNGLNALFSSYEVNGKCEKAGLILAKIANINEINDEFGKVRGDEVIKTFTGIFESIGDRYGFVGRNSGNEFIAVLENCTPDKLKQFLDELDEKVSETNKSDRNNVTINLATATAFEQDMLTGSFSELLVQAYHSISK